MFLEAVQDYIQRKHVPAAVQTERGWLTGFFLFLFLAALANIPLLKVQGNMAWLALRETVWLTTMVLLIGSFVCAGKSINNRWDGIFIDPQNRVSLSRFQLVCWTLLLLAAIITAGFTNAFVYDRAGESLNFTIPGEIWALLGLSSFSAVAAPLITKPRRFRGEVAINETPQEANWGDIIRGDNDGFAYVDVTKLQQLTFTLITFATYAASLWAMFAKHEPIQEFPAVGAGFVALLGISHVAYLTDKQLNNT